MKDMETVIDGDFYLGGRDTPNGIAVDALRVYQTMLPSHISVENYLQYCAQEVYKFRLPPAEIAALPLVPGLLHTRRDILEHIANSSAMYTSTCRLVLASQPWPLPEVDTRGLALLHATFTKHEFESCAGRSKGKGAERLSTEMKVYHVSSKPEQALPMRVVVGLTGDTVTMHCHVIEASDSNHHGNNESISDALQSHVGPYVDDLCKVTNTRDAAESELPKREGTLLCAIVGTMTKDLRR